MKKNIIEMNQTQSDSTKLLYSTFPVHINFKKLSDKAIAPRRGSDGAAGYDLYAAISTPITIAPHTTMMVPTDIAMEIPNGYFGAIFARSGLATRKESRSLSLCQHLMLTSKLLAPLTIPSAQMVVLVQQVNKKWD